MMLISSQSSTGKWHMPPFLHQDTIHDGSCIRSSVSSGNQVRETSPVIFIHPNVVSLGRDSQNETFWDPPMRLGLVSDREHHFHLYRVATSFYDTRTSHVSWRWYKQGWSGVRSRCHATYVAFAFWRQDLYIAFDVELGPFYYGVLGRTWQRFQNTSILYTVFFIYHTLHIWLFYPLVTFDLLHWSLSRQCLTEAHHSYSDIKQVWNSVLTALTYRFLYTSFFPGIWLGGKKVRKSGRKKV